MYVALYCTARYRHQDGVIGTLVPVPSNTFRLKSVFLATFGPRIKIGAFT